MNRLDTLDAQVALAIIIAPDDGFTTAAIRVGMHGRIVALADAVGSRAAGARAAERALEAFFAVATVTTAASAIEGQLRRGFKSANEAIFDEGVPPQAAQTLATSLLVVALGEEGAMVAHVGNARCHRLRAGSSVSLTRVHCALTEMRDGAEERDDPFATHHRHLLTRALGLAEEVTPDISTHVLEPGDWLLVANDSLRWCATEPHLEQLFSGDTTPEALVSTLRGIARGRGIGGAVALVQVSGPPAQDGATRT